MSACVISRQEVKRVGSGVPQGLILGPVPFRVNMVPPANLMTKYSMSKAEDIQYKYLSTANQIRRLIISSKYSNGTITTTVL